LCLGSYSFKDVKEVQVEVDTLETFHNGEEIFHKHDPLKVVSRHCQVCKYRWTYESKTWKDEEIYKITIDYDEVIFKMRGNSQHMDKLQREEESTIERKEIRRRSS
jgi:hypothetical protein